MGFQGFLKQSTAVDVLIGPFVDDTDGNTAETALTISAADVRLSKNGQNIVSKNDATACAHDEIGLYNCELDATDTNTVGQLTLTVHETGALHVRHDFHVVEEAIYDALYGASAAGFDANQRVDVGAWLGTAATSGTGGPDVNVNAISDDLTAATNAEAFFDGTGYAGTGNTIPTVTTLTGHTAQTGDSFARIGATGSGLTTLSTQASVNTIDGNVDTINTATAGLAGAAMRGTDSAALASVVGALTDAAAAGDPTTADTVMQYVKQLINVLIGTAGIGTWPAEAAPGNAVSIAEALRAVATDVSTTIPGTITTLQSDTDDIQTRLPAALVGGAMDCDVSAIQASAITAAAIATDAIGAAELAADAVAEIADQVWDEAIAGHVGAGSTGEALNNATAPTAAAVADAVWDEARSGHVGAGSFGEGIASVQGDVTGNVDGTVATVTTLTGHTAQTGDTFAQLPTNFSVMSIDAGTGLLNVDTVDRLNTQAKADVQAECQLALISYNLDHLMGAAATGTNVTDDSVIAQLVSASATADWDDFDNTTESLQAIRDRGDSAWITGGGGGITDILNVQPLIPAGGIDLANTATWQLGLMLINSLDDLPSTAEITPGTISIDRKAIGGTSWSAVVTDAACSEAAGLIYYDEVFDSGTGYAEGDSIRVTFKSQKITVSANDYEISDATGRLFYTTIRETMRGTDSALLASSDGSGLTEAGGTGDQLTALATAASISALNDPTAATIADSVWDEAIAGHVGAGSTGEALNNATAPTAAAVADAVWDEARSGHVGAGSFGEGVLVEDLNTAAKASVNAEADTALTDYDPPTRAELTTDTGTVTTAISALNDLATSDLDTALATYDGPTNTEMTSAFTEIKGATWSALTDTIEHIRNKQTDIETDTQDLQTQIGTAGAGLTGTALATAASVAALNDISTAEVATELATYDGPTRAEATTDKDAILTRLGTPADTDVSTDVAALNTLIAALNDLSAAAVNAEVVDVIRTDALTLPGQGAPSVTPTLSEAVAYLFKAWRNKSDLTAGTTYRLYDDAGSTIDQQATVSDDGTTSTRGEVGSG